MTDAFESALFTPDEIDPSAVVADDQQRQEIEE